MGKWDLKSPWLPAHFDLWQWLTSSSTGTNLVLSLVLGSNVSCCGWAAKRSDITRFVKGTKWIVFGCCHCTRVLREKLQDRAHYSITTMTTIWECFCLLNYIITKALCNWNSKHCRLFFFLIVLLDTWCSRCSCRKKKTDAVKVWGGVAHGDHRNRLKVRKKQKRETWSLGQ